MTATRVYSVHYLEVECICKGKAHKRYEFGCKTGIVTSATGNWVFGCKAFHGNPYDGHTLKENLEQAERLIGRSIKQAVCDLGYRKHNYDGDADVQIVKTPLEESEEIDAPLVEEQVSDRTNYRSSEE